MRETCPRCRQDRRLTDYTPHFPEFAWGGDRFETIRGHFYLSSQEGVRVCGACMKELLNAVVKKIATEEG